MNPGYRLSFLMILAVALLLSALEAGAAEYRIEMSDGRVYTGEIVAESEETLTVQMGSVRRMLFKAEIEERSEIVTPTPIPPPSPTPTPDLPGELERTAYPWSIRLLTTDFSGMWEETTPEFRERFSQPAFVAFMRNRLRDTGRVKPIDLELDVQGLEAVVRQGMPAANGGFTDPEAWPWTSRWVRQEGAWYQAPDLTETHRDELEQHQARISNAPTPTPTGTPAPSPTERVSRNVNVEVREFKPLPTKTPTPVPEAAELVLADSDILSETEAALQRFPDFAGIWADLLMEQQIVVAVILGLHLLFCLWVLIDSRRHVGRPVVTTLGIFLGGLLSGCMPVAWVAYLLIRGRL